MNKSSVYKFGSLKTLKVIKFYFLCKPETCNVFNIVLAHYMHFVFEMQY